jgi:1,2-phenylacetyl-CoA epoxidase PaaB subunit
MNETNFYIQWTTIQQRQQEALQRGEQARLANSVTATRQMNGWKAAQAVISRVAAGLQVWRVQEAPISGELCCAAGSA